MRERSAFTRVFALFLTAELLLPPQALALRQVNGGQGAGLEQIEEQLTSTSSGLEEKKHPGSLLDLKIRDEWVLWNLDQPEQAVRITLKSIESERAGLLFQAPKTILMRRRREEWLSIVSKVAGLGGFDSQDAKEYLSGLVKEKQFSGGRWLSELRVKQAVVLHDTTTSTHAGTVFVNKVTEGEVQLRIVAPPWIQIHPSRSYDQMMAGRQPGLPVVPSPAGLEENGKTVEKLQSISDRLWKAVELNQWKKAGQVMGEYRQMKLSRSLRFNGGGFRDLMDQIQIAWIQTRMERNLADWAIGESITNAAAKDLRAVLKMEIPQLIGRRPAPVTWISDLAKNMAAQAAMILSASGRYDDRKAELIMTDPHVPQGRVFELLHKRWLSKVVQEEKRLGRLELPDPAYTRALAYGLLSVLMPLKKHLLEGQYTEAPDTLLVFLSDWKNLQETDLSRQTLNNQRLLLRGVVASYVVDREGNRGQIPDDVLDEALLSSSPVILELAAVASRVIAAVAGNPDEAEKFYSLARRLEQQLDRDYPGYATRLKGRIRIDSEIASVGNRAPFRSPSPLLEPRRAIPYLRAIQNGNRRAYQRVRLFLDEETQNPSLYFHVPPDGVLIPDGFLSDGRGLRVVDPASQGEWFVNIYVPVGGNFPVWEVMESDEVRGTIRTGSTPDELSAGPIYLKWFPGRGVIVMRNRRVIGNSPVLLERVPGEIKLDLSHRALWGQILDGMDGQALKQGYPDKWALLTARPGEAVTLFKTEDSAIEIARSVAGKSSSDFNRRWAILMASLGRGTWDSAKLSRMIGPVRPGERFKPFRVAIEGSEPEWIHFDWRRDGELLVSMTPRRLTESNHALFVLSAVIAKLQVFHQPRALEEVYSNSSVPKLMKLIRQNESSNSSEGYLIRSIITGRLAQRRDPPAVNAVLARLKHDRQGIPKELSPAIRAEAVAGLIRRHEDTAYTPEDRRKVREAFQSLLMDVGGENYGRETDPLVRFHLVQGYGRLVPKGETVEERDVIKAAMRDLQVVSNSRAEQPWVRQIASNVYLMLEQQLARGRGRPLRFQEVPPRQRVTTGLEETEIQDGSMVRLPANFPSGVRIFYHPALLLSNFSGLEKIALPGKPGEARLFLRKMEVRPGDLILLPDSIGAGLEEAWRLPGVETPIVVGPPSLLMELTPRHLAALREMAQNRRGHILRAGLEEWDQTLVDGVEYMGRQG